MTDQTDLQREIQFRLGLPLQDWVLGGRADGKSWRTLSLQIRRLTGIRVSYQGLINWYGKADQ